MNENACPVCQNPMRLKSTRPIRTTADILPHLEHYRNKRQEFFVCISLDSSSRPIARRIVTIGTLTSTLVHPREIFADPIADRAAAIIIAHNHPSGDALPSREDIETTQQIVAASLILGIQLRDHVIVAAEEHYSFRKHRML